MPDRIVRDELLTSERYWACSPEARNLFLSIILSVDDAARMSGSLFALRTRCMASTVSHERIAAILAELVDAELVIRYEGADRKPYLFLPRSRQRKRYISSSKHPPPPQTINDITSEKSDSSRTQVSLKTREVGVGVEVGVDKKRTSMPQPGDNLPTGVTWAQYWKAKGKALGIEPNKGETDRQYCDRVRLRIKGD